MDDRDLMLSEIATRFGLLPKASWSADFDYAIDRLCERYCLGSDELRTRLRTNRLLQRELAGYLTVEESYFLRDSEQFEIFADHIEQQLVGERPAQKLVVWSAGCACGEEPYSAAITLWERFRGAISYRVEILASDLNGTAIAAAKRGVYSPWSFRDVPAHIIRQYFEPAGGNSLQVSSRIRDSVRFMHMALLEHLCLIPSASLNVVFFRNVAIYLKDSALDEVYEGFARVIKDGGLLILAPADTLPPGDSFEKLKRRGCIFVRRRPGAARQEATSAPVVVARKRMDDPAKGAELSQVQALALESQGCFDEALQVATGIIERSPSQAAGFLLRGKISLSAMYYKQAVADLRRALFLNPEALVGRYWYAQALKLAGQTKQSVIQIRELTSQLAETPADTVLEDGKTTAAGLLKIVGVWKRKES
jgi:chemotaxis protein methyltransferase CheR